MAPKKGTTPPPQDENETPPEEPPVHEEQQEPTMQQILEIIAQQQKQTNALVTMLVGAKGAGKGGGNPTGDGAEPPAFQRSTMVKPETAPVFNGRGYELWKKNLDDWESLHYAVDEYQKPGLLMRALQGEVLSLVRAEFAFGQCVACPLMSWFNGHQITVISSFGRCSRYVRYGAPSVAV